MNRRSAAPAGYPRGGGLAAGPNSIGMKSSRYILLIFHSAGGLAAADVPAGAVAIEALAAGLAFNAVQVDP